MAGSAPMLLTVVLFGPDRTQLCQPAFIKTTGDTPMSKLTACFCRWLQQPETAVGFTCNGKPLQTGSATPTELGLANGGTLHATLADGATLGEPPAGLPFLDVTDYELSALADLLSVAR